MLAYSDLSLLVKAGVQWGLFGGALLHLGSESHRRRYLPDALGLRLVGCFGMTETGHGSDVHAIRTTASYEPASQEFVVDTPDDDAAKDYIGNAACDATVAVVFAQLLSRGENHGVHAFVVPIRTADGAPCPGVRIEDCGHKAGLNGVDNGRLWFEHVRVPRDALLDRHGTVSADGRYSSPIDNPTRRFFTMLGTLVQGRVSVSGAAVAAAELALTIAVRYALVRRQFRAPGHDGEIILLDYRVHQRRLLPLLASTYAFHFAQNALVSRLHDVFSAEISDERARRELESLAAGIKALATWHATRAIQTCREACGGAGYLSENRLADLRADSDVFTTFEGDNTVLLQLVARGLLTDYRDEFGSLDTFGTVRFLADQVVEAVAERISARPIAQRVAAAVPGREDQATLLDRGYQLHLFAWREKHVVAGLARRLRAGIESGADPFEVFNDAQDHVLLGARAHVERIVLDEFAAAAAGCADPGSAALLNRLCDLHALSSIEQDRAWYLEHGQLSPTRAKDVITAVNTLCRELRADAGALVEGFGIPEELVAAPIATGAERRRQQARAAGG
jgi:acyl-CoA oxidase